MNFKWMNPFSTNKTDQEVKMSIKDKLKKYVPVLGKANFMNPLDVPGLQVQEDDYVNPFETPQNSSLNKDLDDIWKYNK